MKKATPYNTGKVLIGSSYVPTVRHEVSRDMLRLQTALILNKEASLFKRFERVLKITIENYIGGRHENEQLDD